MTKLLCQLLLATVGVTPMYQRAFIALNEALQLPVHDAPNHALASMWRPHLLASKSIFDRRVGKRTLQTVVPELFPVVAEAKPGNTTTDPAPTSRNVDTNVGRSRSPTNNSLATIAKSRKLLRRKLKPARGDKAQSPTVTRPKSAPAGAKGIKSIRDRVRQLTLSNMFKVDRELSPNAQALVRSTPSYAIKSPYLNDGRGADSVGGARGAKYWSERLQIKKFASATLKAEPSPATRASAAFDLVPLTARWKGSLSNRTPRHYRRRRSRGDGSGGQTRRSDSSMTPPATSRSGARGRTSARQKLRAAARTSAMVSSLGRSRSRSTKRSRSSRRKLKNKHTVTSRKPASSGTTLEQAQVDILAWHLWYLPCPGLIEIVQRAIDSLLMRLEIYQQPVLLYDQSSLALALALGCPDAAVRAAQVASLMDMQEPMSAFSSLQRIVDQNRYVACSLLRDDPSTTPFSNLCSALTTSVASYESPLPLPVKLERATITCKLLRCVYSPHIC